jgi:hypothetical protein
MGRSSAEKNIGLKATGGEKDEKEEKLAKGKGADKLLTKPEAHSIDWVARRGHTRWVRLVGGVG